MELLIVLIISAGLGIITGKIAEKKGYSFWAWWFYGWMLFIVAIIHVNLIPDKNQTALSCQNIPTGAAVQSAADEIKKWKELLETGAITQEEFDAKKKQLLGL